MFRPLCCGVICGLMLVVVPSTTVADPAPQSTLGWMINGTVSEVVRAGDIAYLGGSFRTVSPSANQVRQFVAFSTRSARPVLSRLRINGRVRAVAELAGGGWIIAGEFTSINGSSRQRLARLHANGALDTTSGRSDLASFSTGSAGTGFAADVAAGTYHLRMRSANDFGVSGASDEFAFTVGAATCTAPPLPPLDLRAEVAGSDVTMTWRASPHRGERRAGAAGTSVQSRSAPHGQQRRPVMGRPGGGDGAVPLRRRSGQRAGVEQHHDHADERDVTRRDWGATGRLLHPHAPWALREPGL